MRIASAGGTDRSHGYRSLRSLDRPRCGNRLPGPAVGGAVLIVATSNDLLNAACAIRLGRYRAGTHPAGVLALLGVAGLALALQPTAMMILE